MHDPLTSPEVTTGDFPEAIRTLRGGGGRQLACFKARRRAVTYSTLADTCPDLWMNNERHGLGARAWMSRNVTGRSVPMTPLLTRTARPSRQLNHRRSWTDVPHRPTEPCSSRIDPPSRVVRTTSNRGRSLKKTRKSGRPGRRAPLAKFGPVSEPAPWPAWAQSARLPPFDRRLERKLKKGGQHFLPPRRESGRRSR